jgi:catechol O-methyltransferase
MPALPLFFRWSFLRMAIGMKKLLSDWQVGDGREQGALDHVLRSAPAGDLDAAIAAIDAYAYEKSFLINVGDEKGKILDAAVERLKPRRVLELGAYVGYSALRIARQLPAGAQLFSVEFNADNARIARRMAEHAGVSDRVTFIVGTLGDGGRTLRELSERHGFGPGSLDLVFIDHDKDAYLPDLLRIVDAGWLHPGSVAVADNVRFPGAPAYRAHMQAEEGRRWTTEEHATTVEYQRLIPDLVLVSTFRG